MVPAFVEDTDEQEIAVPATGDRLVDETLDEPETDVEEESGEEVYRDLTF